MAVPVGYSHPRASRSCTFCKCQQPPRGGQRLHTRWSQLWHSQGKEQIPTQTRKPQIRSNRASWFFVFVFLKSDKKQRLFSLCHTYISSFGTIARSVDPWEPGRIFTLQDLSSPGHSVGPASCLMRTDTLVLRRGHTGPRGEEALWCPQAIYTFQVDIVPALLIF